MMIDIQLDATGRPLIDPKSGVPRTIGSSSSDAQNAS